MPKKSNELDSEIDALFMLPLAEFTAARNALSARLKKAGRAEDADAVKAIQKPTASAWAVNQLAWQHPKDIDALLSVGDRFRAAQAAQLSGKAGDLRGLLNERRDVLAGLMKQANAMLEAAGHNASPDMGRRVATTLEALATWGRAEGAPQAGRLTDDLDPPGFEALAALVPRSSGSAKGAEPPRVLPFRQEPRPRRGKDRKEEDAEARRAKAREAVQAAEKALLEAQRETERAEAALKNAAARAKAAEKAKAELEPRYEQAVAAAQETAKEARRVAQEAEDAAQSVTDAEQALEKAKAALESL